MKMPTITTRKEPDIRRILSHERRHLGMRGRPMAKLDLGTSIQDFMEPC
jgi:hypothetical protein